MPTVAEHIEQLQRLYKAEDIIALIIWETSDVVMRGEERDIEIPQDIAEKIVNDIERNHDAGLGVTWDTLDYYIDEYKEGRLAL